MDKNTLPTIEIGDDVQVKEHVFKAGFYHPCSTDRLHGEAVLYRKTGWYRVYWVFRNGNIFASLIGSGDPQVIEPKHILGKVEERRAA